MIKKADVIVGQSGGCTAVINQTLAGVIDAAKKDKRVGTIWGMRSGVCGILNNSYVNLSRLNKNDLLKLGNTPASALGSCRHKLSKDECVLVVKKMKRKNVRYFLLVGGNDTALTSHMIHECAKSMGYDLFVIALPKTIDNDLPYMDHSPGFASNARFIACTTQEAGKDTEAMKLVDPIKIIEVMGRNSGWLVAASALGKKSKYDAPHLLYFPERPFDVKQCIRDVKRVYNDIGYCVIVVSETIRDKSGRRVGERRKGITKDPFGHALVDSVGAKLSAVLEAELKVRARYDKPGTIQRMSMAYISKIDQKEAFMVGKKGMQLALAGKSGQMVTIERISNSPYRSRAGYVSVEKIAGKEKYMPASFINKEANFITPSFKRYAAPLVGNIPQFIRL